MKQSSQYPFLKSRLATSIMLTGALALTSNVALAAEQTTDSDQTAAGFYVVPSIGLIKPDNQRDLKNSRAVSLGAGYHFNNPWSVELSYLQSELDLENANGSIDYSHYRLDALYDLPSDGKLTPYAVFGGGQSEVDARFSNNEETFVNVGFGLKYAITNQFALRSDIRGVRHTESESDDLLLNFGATFSFGHSKSSSRKPVSSPSPVKIDSDKDGVADSKDNCLNTKSGVAVDAYGCELNNDLDNDGVANNIDACPDTKPGAKVTQNGCYETLTKDVSISLNIMFENNSDQLVSGSQNKITELAKFMQSYPQTKVIVNGYTDSVGSKTYNQQLSQRRADKVAQILADEYGISSSRISSIGHGVNNPIATNATREGRAKNRRVDATVKATKVIVQE